MVQRKLADRFMIVFINMKDVNLASLLAHVSKHKRGAMSLQELS